MAKVILYIAMSLDGFIARKNGGIDWLSPYENKQEDYGYKDFYKTIQTIIMGNNTYKQALSFDKFPFKGKNCFVFTKDRSRIKDKNVTFVNINVKRFIKQLKPNKNIWVVGGASIIDEFLKHDLIDEFIITIIPILLGEGIPLFKENEKKLKLVNAKAFNSGLVQLVYRRR
ncbi:MAG: dihydrofolate reductase family protein [Nanoarchaeota archaeon]